MKTKATDTAVKAMMLRASPGFNGLSDAGLQALAQVAVLREYDGGESLFRQEENAAGFFVMVSGVVTVFRAGTDGRQQILHVFEDPGEVCGEVPVFEGGTYPAAAEVSSVSRLLYLPRTEFLAITRRHPEILLEMLAVLSRRLRRFVGLIDDLSLKDVAARLAKYILVKDGETGGDFVDLGMSKGMLASRLGTIAETISRTFRKMQQAGLVAVDGRIIHLLDRKRLAAVADGEVGL